MTTKEKKAEQWLFLSFATHNHNTGHPMLYGAEITVHKSYRSLRHSFKKAAKSPDTEIDCIPSWHVWQKLDAPNEASAKICVESTYCFSKDGDVMHLRVVNSPKEIDKAIAEKRVPVQLKQHPERPNRWHVKLTDLIWYVNEPNIISHKIERG